MPTPSQNLQLSFIKKELVAQNTWAFYFDRKDIIYDFFPGQYNRISLPITPTDGRGASRFFTICSSPLQKDYLMITTKIEETHSQFKEALTKLSPGQTVKFFGPIGGFYFHDEEIRPHVFLAGGIGITPFHSMITYAAQKSLLTQMTLIVSFSTNKEMIFYSELTAIAKSHPNIKIIYTITHPETSSDSWNKDVSFTPWKGETGRISPELIRKYILDITKPIYFIVGPPPMVDGTIDLLKSMQIPDEQVRAEHFTGY